MKTQISIKEDKFLINNQLTYQEIKTVNPKAAGLLLNARFIQGIFDDASQPERFNRFGREFDPDKNTDDLIKALPQWHQYGLRAFTVGFQGGGPCYTTDNMTINNNPYSSDGSKMDPSYLDRMSRLIKAADQIGMIVIVSLFYGAQSRFLNDDQAVQQAVMTASEWLKEQQFTNVIIEIANEHDVSDFKIHPVIFEPEGIVKLIKLARQASGGMPVGCSGTGGAYSEKIATASDVILIHGNGQSRQNLYNLIMKAKKVKPMRPIVCNEDSQAISNLDVCVKESVSWGYYNNLSKQEPPACWEIQPGEDTFFANRMAKSIGIQTSPIPFENQFYLHGFEPEITVGNKRWIRLGSLYPESIDFVEFYRNGQLFATAYDDPFMVNHIGNWMQGPVIGVTAEDNWTVVVHFASSPGQSPLKAQIAALDPGKARLPGV